MKNTYTPLLLFAACVALAGCVAEEADPEPPRPHDVDWIPADGTTINMGACTGIEVSVWSDGAGGTTVTLPCDATSTVLAFDPADPILNVDVDYRYTMIPFGCESEDCYVPASMARGSADVDAATTSTTVVVEAVINLPF